MSWWGLWLLAALDSTMVFFLPFGIDIAIIILASRSHELFWLYPILASGGSLCGAAITYYVGRRLGEAGLEHFVPKNQLNGFRRRIEDKGAVALAVLDLIPPPFPFTACILAAGALKVSTPIFFITLGATRLLRFGVEAVFAYFYGRQIIGWDEILEGGLAPNASVMSWRGEQGGIDAAKLHHDVVMTPGDYVLQVVVTDMLADEKHRVASQSMDFQIVK